MFYMSWTATSLSSAFQPLLDDAVARGVAPGFQCVIFNRSSLVFNGVSGLASIPSETTPEGKAFKQETPVFLASATKLCISLIVLHIIERGLAKTGFAMRDLDSHEALVEVLPEFKRDSGSLVTKIIEGFEEALGKDGKKVMKLRDAKGQVTLRMLLTHTAGIASYWNHPHATELYRPSDGSVPNFALPSGGGGDIREFEIPLVAEPNSTYIYGTGSADWLGQFAVRSTGKHLRQLFKEIIFEPLGIPESEADLWLSPDFLNARADLHIRIPNKGFMLIPFSLYAPEGEPPQGKSYYASGGVWASIQAYAKVLQAVLNQDPRILCSEVWQMAIKDDLKGRNIRVPKPEWTSNMPDFTHDMNEYAKSTAKDGTGINLLQCRVATAPTVSGRSAGSFGWAGLTNTYYFIDPVKGVGAIFGTEYFPFYDPQIIEMRDELESLVYKTLFPV